jgi:hypothetical protein
VISIISKVIMHQHWFYGQEGNRLGPCTAQQLRELAIAGKILLTDTVWKEGIDRGVLATRVKNLFPLPATLSLSRDFTASVSQPAVPESSHAEGPLDKPTPRGSLEDAPEVVGSLDEGSPVKTPAPYQPSAEKKQVRKGRASAIKGAKITGQDGTTVQFRKLCTTCGYEDPSRATMPIRTGMTRIPFYCRKCRKPRDVEIQGMY